MTDLSTRYIAVPALAVLMALLVPTPAGARSHENSAQAAEGAPNVRMVQAGKKEKIKAVIARRDADAFYVKEALGTEVVVVLSDSIRIQIDGKPITDAQRFELRKLVGGIIVQIEGVGNSEGKLVAQKVSFSYKDIRNAQAIAGRVNPVEQRVTEVEGQQAALAGQVDELTALTKMATEEAQRANNRISALDNFTVLDTASVTFAVNSSTLSATAKQSLDAIAAKSAPLKAVAFEITGYTDTTGNAEKNRILSDKRANAVVRYLADTHNIPLRRIVTPLGYGQARPVADNTTVAGREQNRRVEVKLMQQGGI